MEKQPLVIFSINETRLDKSIPDCQINLSGYNLVRRDRNRKGGGVCIYIRSSIDFKRRLDVENENLEMVALSIKSQNPGPFSSPVDIDLLTLL